MSVLKSIRFLNHSIKSSFYVGAIRLCTTTPKPKRQPIGVTFVKPSGNITNAKGKEGDSLLDLVVKNNVGIDGFGACEGTIACSTCHVILNQDVFDAIKDKPTDEELDMLDLAYGLTNTSRLGCQVYVTKDLDGIQVQVPESVKDARNI